MHDPLKSPNKATENKKPPRWERLHSELHGGFLEKIIGVGVFLFINQNHIDLRAFLANVVLWKNVVFSFFRFFFGGGCQLNYSKPRFDS